MSHHAKSLGSRSGLTYVERARRAWGAEINSCAPDWVFALASAADQYRADGKSLSDLGARVGLHNSVVSAVIGKSYAGRYDAIEAKVRGALMNATVVCPVEGEIGRDRCASNQALKFSAANPARAKFPFACKACVNRVGGSGLASLAPHHDGVILSERSKAERAEG